MLIAGKPPRLTPTFWRLCTLLYRHRGDVVPQATTPFRKFCELLDMPDMVSELPDILRARIFAIACGYEDADDLDRLRCDPAFKLACGRLPDSGTDLCSQPTISR